MQLYKKLKYLKENIQYCVWNIIFACYLYFIINKKNTMLTQKEETEWCIVLNKQR